MSRSNLTWLFRGALITLVAVGIIWGIQNRGTPVCPTTTEEAVRMFGGTDANWVQLSPNNWLFFVPNEVDQSQPEIVIPRGYRLVDIDSENNTTVDLTPFLDSILRFTRGTNSNLIYLGCP